MRNSNMDLTGAHKNYAEANRVWRIFKYDQLVDFEATVFAESLEVYLLSSGVKSQLLTRGIDYDIPDAFIASCDNDVSNAKLADGMFDKELVSGIRMLRGINNGSTITISVSYQRLYPNQLRTGYYHNEPFNLTPELALDMVKSIETLKLLVSRVTDVGSLTTDQALLLEFDETKTNLNNFIEDEEHLLNVPGGRFMIHPKGGGFYGDTVTVFHPSTGQTLIRNQDYFIVGMDEPKTKATSHTAAVYNFIMVVKPIADEVKISYHAFGGDPTLDNYRQLLKNVNNVIQYLNDANSLTSESLGGTEVMMALFERVELLEAKMRRLEGTPSYGDITSGKCILMKLFSETPGLHWYTIAKLYTVGGSTTPCVADTMIFRLQSKLSHFQFTAAASVDLSNLELDRFNLNVISDNYPKGYSPFTDYSNIDKIIRPQMRVVWAEDDKVTGAYLQLGFELKGIMEEVISIEDISGHESCWVLVDEITTSTTPMDTDFLLPNGSTWSPLIPAARQESMLIPFSRGHLAWSGVQPLNRPENGWQQFVISDHYLSSNTDIRRIKKMRLNIEEKSGLQFPVDVMFNSGTDHLKGHATFTHQEKPVYINAEIFYEDKQIVIRLNYDVVAGVDATELDLRDIAVFC